MYSPDQARDRDGKWSSGGILGHIGGRGRGLSGGLFGPARTAKWRIAVRGQQRVDEARGRARIAREMETQTGYFSPDRQERRRLAMLPGAKFDARGNLSNLAEMKSRHGLR